MMAGKFMRMTAESVHARLRHGRLRFQEAIHVPGDLTISDPTIQYLCNALRVDGGLDLSGCTRLEALPERLIVRGALIIDRCVSLKRLPSGLHEVNRFSAEGCTALKSIAPIGVCHGPVNLIGCAGLEPLTPDFRATTSLQIDHCIIFPRAFCVDLNVPETIIAVAPGRRIRELIDHRLLSRHPIREEVVTHAERDLALGDLRLGIDATSLVIKEGQRKGRGRGVGRLSG
ncbi:hypothetical protein [Sphingomonas koreensis]|nr:hypothetical protein [Sphingomonas koreensis]